MPFKADPFSLDSNEKAIRVSGGARRTALLLGTSLLVYAAIPSAALAQECGAPAANTVSCPPSGNPYAGGINYPAQVQDLTIVLEPDVVVTDTVQTTSVTANVDLRIEGGTDTLISTGANSDGVDIDSSASTGTVYASLDLVTTTGNFSNGIDAHGGAGASVFVNSVTTDGDFSGGIEATANGGSVFVAAGSVTTDGKYSDGIFASNPSGTVEVTSGTVTTSGLDSDGILAYALGSIDITSNSVSTDGEDSTGIGAYAFGSGIIAGSVNISSGSVATHDIDSTGILATSANGSVTITSNSVTTEGVNSPGIEATADLDDFDATATVSSGTVSTLGADSGGIYAAAGGYVNVTSGTVTTAGDNSIGIYAHQFISIQNNDIIGSGAAAIIGEGPPAVIGVGPGVVIDSDAMSTTGNNSPGIFGISDDGFVQITSGTVTTTGTNSQGIIADALTDVGIASTSVTTSGAGSTGIQAFAETGYITITSGTVTTTGADSTGILALAADGAITIASGSVSTDDINSRGIDADGAGDIAITSTGSVTTTGTDSDGILGNSKYGAVNITSNSVTTQEDNSIGIGGYSTTNVTIGSTTVTTHGDYSAGIFAEQSGPTGPGPAALQAPSGAAAVIGVGPGVTITSGSVTTTGDHSDGIIGNSVDGFVQITSTTVNTSGLDSAGIVADADEDILVTSGTVHTTGDNSFGIDAFSKYGPVTVTSTTLTTAGPNSTGIAAESKYSVTVNSTTLSTIGINSPGIDAESKYGPVTVTSANLNTSGANSTGIVAETGGFLYGGGNVTVTNTGTVGTTGTGAGGIVAIAGISPIKYSDGGNVVITSNIVTTTGADDAAGITGTAHDNVTITSTNVSTTGTNSDGIDALAKYGNVAVTSGTVTTNGDNSAGISALAPDGTVTVTSGTVTTHGAGAPGIEAVASSDVTVGSTSVTTTGAGSTGIFAYSDFDNVSVTSGTVSTSGADSDGIYAYVYSGGNTTVVSGSVTTTGANSRGIYAYAFNGNTSVTSTTVSTAGANSVGIQGIAILGSTTITSGNVTTTGAGSDGINAYATDDVTVTSTGTVRTAGLDADGIVATAVDRVVVNSNIVITTGNNSAGIYATEFGAPGGGGGDAIIPGGAAVLGPNGGITITSGSITTSGSGSVGIDAFAVGGDVEITSTGTIATSGASSHGIISVTLAGITTLDVNNISVTGATADAVRVTSVGASTITVRGLVLATGGFEIQANGAAATVNTTATGTIRGAIDLTDNADRVNNAGTFDAIGTSLFGAGSDIFTNTGLTSSFNGAAVFTGLESFINGVTGRIDMRDGAVGDTLNVVGAYNGLAGSRLLLDANNQTRLADVLITGAATGSTTLDVILLAPPVIDLVGTLVVDASTGTNSAAFTLGTVSLSSPFVRLGLLFDAPNNNFLLVGLPDQTVFETIGIGGMVVNFWYETADAISAQLQGAHDGTGAGPQVSNLTGSGRLGGWVQLHGGETERDATQSFTGGGNTSVFDTSYQQDFQGIQGGLDYQSGGTILGVSFGLLKSDAEFDVTFNPVEMDGMNFAAYAAFNSGGFFVNVIAKAEWVDVEASPGGGISSEFDATAWGVRGTVGYRFQLGGHAFAEPAASLSWVNVDIDDYTAAGATVVFDEITSLRGTAGLRIGAAYPNGHGGTWTPFIGIHAVEEFDGDARNTFTMGQSITIVEDAPGTYGEVSAGLNFSTGTLEAFIRGELNFGGETEGMSGRAGLRLRF